MSKKLKKQICKLLCLIMPVILIGAFIGGSIYWRPKFFRGTRSAEIWTPLDVFAMGDHASLSMEDGEFRILQLSDTQLSHQLRVNRDCFALIRKLVDETNPHLIILMGDNASTAFNGWLIRQLVRVLDDIGIPYAPVLGNHCGEGWWDHERVGEMFERGEH